MPRDPSRLQSGDELFPVGSDRVTRWQRAAAVTLVRRRCPDADLILTMLGLT